jgi:hypothetical protein
MKRRRSAARWISTPTSRRRSARRWRAGAALLILGGVIALRLA